MQKLTSYSKNGYHMNLVKREDNVAIFDVKNGEKLAGYEVIIIKEREETELFGKIMPATEYPPSNEKFGITGWYFQKLEHAETKFSQVIKKEKEKAEKNKIK